jgi:hypothetical protein
MTVARPRVGPLALGRAALPGGEPLTSWHLPGEPADAMGMVAGPRASNPTPASPFHDLWPSGGGPEFESPAAASLRALARDAAGTAVGPNPGVALVPSLPRASIVVRAGRATRVP